MDRGMGPLNDDKLIFHETALIYDKKTKQITNTWPRFQILA